MKNRLIQAYKQAPWRIQLQWIGLFLLGLLLIASVTGVYLSVSAQAAAAGRRIQSLERRINNINNEITQLTSDLASAKSAQNMSTRAEELGFILLDPHQAMYLEIPGYRPKADLILAPPRENLITQSPIVRSSYRSSVWDWLLAQIQVPSFLQIQAEEESIP